MLSKNPVAVKIHGVAAGVIPEQIPKSVLEIIAKSGRPIILHTDNINGSLENPFDYLRKSNSASRWIDVLSDHGVKGYISHGAYLCKDAFKKINDSDNFLLGLGPIKLIEADKSNLLQSIDISYEGYLHKIFDQVNINKIAFDIDFPCNVMDFNYTSEDLVSKDFVASKLGQTERKKVFLENAEKFFEN
jgi:hypothetical protein